MLYLINGCSVKVLITGIDMSEEIVQTQLKLLLKLFLKEQSDQGLHCLPFRLHCLDTRLYGMLKF